MKPISFLGDSRDAIRDFPDGPRYRAGVELRAVQNGLDPDDWKPMKAVGPGVREIRIRDASGAFRIIYLATMADRVLVLPCVSEKDPADGAAGYRAGRKTPQGLEGATMNGETFDSVFDALADTAAEAANMTARADLLLAIRERVKAWNLTQEQAAVRLGLTRPRLNDLMRGKLDKFSLDALVNIAAAAGFKLHIELEDAKAA
jgi:predicted XRE-type DNA-binding protein/phage-related protein